MMLYALRHLSKPFTSTTKAEKNRPIILKWKNSTNLENLLLQKKKIMTELPFNSMDSIYELVDCLDEY